MPFYQLIFEQKIPASKNEVWNFIVTPENLQKITPPEMGFKITSQGDFSKMYEGMIIAYKVKPILNITTTWVTEITQIKHQEFFVDEQRIGPYKMWHHEHHIKEIEGGVLMTDIISYQPPFGFLGTLANKIVIAKKLRSIFDFRKGSIENIFGRF